MHDLETAWRPNPDNAKNHVKNRRGDVHVSTSHRRQPGAVYTCWTGDATYKIQTPYEWDPTRAAFSFLGSWHTRPLYMRQRSVQVRLEGLNILAWALTIVARMNSRISRNSFLEPRCMYFASKAVQLHAYRYPPRCNGSLVALGEPATMDSTTPTNGHVSHDAHVAAKCCCAPACLFSVWCAQAEVQPPSSVDATVRIRACLTAHSPNIRTVPAVLNRMIGSAMNRNGLHVRPSFARCIRACYQSSKLRRLSRQAQRRIINYAGSDNNKTYHCLIEHTETYHIGFPGAPVTAIRHC